MSKLLNDESRIVAQRREAVKERTASSDLPDLPEPAPEPSLKGQFQSLVPVSTALEPQAVQPESDSLVENGQAVAGSQSTAALEAPVTPAEAPFAFSAPIAAPPAPAAPPLNRVPLPTMSPEALRYARRWYSTVSFVIVAGIIWGLVTILRTNKHTAATATHVRPARHTVQEQDLVGPPSAPAAPAPSAAATPESPAPVARVRANRDPFFAALLPAKKDAALDEAQRVYSLMESTLRSAATTLPNTHAAPSPEYHRRGE